MEAYICSQCGAPLNGDVCEYCGTCFDVDYEYDNVGLNNVCYDADVYGSVSDLCAMMPVILVIAPIAMFIKWVYERWIGDIDVTNE